MTPGFSADSRLEDWRALSGRTFDLLVIGGGVTGAGVALVAADRGLRTALVEQGDFGSGTSGRSSRLIHGGLRYLENGDFGLVFEASAERHRLLKLAPHLVRPLPFIFPVYEHGPVGYRKLQAGMWLYDFLALFRNIKRHRMLNRKEALAAEPLLNPDGLKGGALYYDAAVDDARLALATARAARRAGARTVSYAEVTGFEFVQGRLAGARARDRFGGETVTARARLVLNATGPWLDHLRRMADPGVKPRLRPTQGVHLMVRRERLDIRSAVVFPSPVDGRVMFLLPWGAFAYLGTTDTDFTGDPGGVRHRPEDIDYLLASANGIAPAARLTRGDVLSSWAGVRPLLAEEEGTSAGQTSREHEIWRDPSGLLNAGGGKLTTFLSMAAEVVDQAAEVLKEEHGVEAHGAGSAREPLPGAPSEPWKSFLGRIERAARRVHLPDSTAEQLARAHGTGGFEVIERVRERTELAEPLVPGLPHLRAEVVHAVEKEMALTVEDVLRRRTHVFYQAPDGGVSAAAKTARWMHEAGVKRSRAAWDEQVAAYARGVRENRNFDG